MSADRPTGGGRTPPGADPPGVGGTYVVGVMRMEVEGRDSDRFLGYVEAAFAFGGVLGRGRLLAEPTVVTSAATVLSLLLTMLLLFCGFALLVYGGIVTIFPPKLMETWPTVDPAVRTIDHVRMSLFVAALAVRAGSLGGRADSQALVRGVLFSDEET